MTSTTAARHPDRRGRRRLAGQVLDQVERAVVGKRDALVLVLAGVLAGGHVLIEDLPGPRQDARRPVVRADARAASSPARSSPPTCCRPT